MRIEKKTLNDALRVLGKVVCQTSPVELYRSVRFVGDADGVMAMATDGVEVVSVILDAFTHLQLLIVRRNANGQAFLPDYAFFDLTAARMPGAAARVLTDAAYTLVPGQAQRRGGIMPPMRTLRSQLLF